MKIRTSVGAVLAAASSIVLAAPHASAATGDFMVYTTDTGDPAAFAWWHPYGEHWGVCDDEKDGKRAIAQLKDLDAGVQYGLVDDTGYDNTCAAAATSFNITDGHRIALRVCLRDGAPRPVLVLQRVEVRESLTAPTPPVMGHRVVRGAPEASSWGSPSCAC